MSHSWLFEVFRFRKGYLLMVGMAVAVGAVLLLFFINPRYQVRTDFLVSQADSETKDYYTLARSSEYIGKVLGEVAYSERFIAAVVDTGKVNTEFLPFEQNARIKAWRAMLSINQELNLGVLHITVFADNNRQGERVAQAVAQVLIAKNGQLLGTGDRNIPMSILSGPITEMNPSNQKIAVTALSGFVFGALLALLRLFFQQEVWGEKSLASRDGR